MEPKALASQLRRPSGEDASEIASKMNEANQSLNHKCIDLLMLRGSDSVLELGPGNGAFASNIINSAKDVTYVGIDWSEDMVAEARRLNESLVNRGCVTFKQGSSMQLPFEDDTFDKVLTVHTVYFWDQPLKHLLEIKRVLKPSGVFCIAFGEREFMQNLPFVAYGFELYDLFTVCNLLRVAGFDVSDRHQFMESGVSNTGETVDKTINIILCRA